MPGDGPVGENSVFRGTLPKAIFELRNDLLDALEELQDAVGWTLDNSRNFDLSTKMTHKIHWNNLFRIFPDTRRCSEYNLDPV